MDKPRIVITGVGVVAPNGIGKEEFWKACQAGVSGIKPITLFDTSKYRCRYGGEVSNFQPQNYLGSKGLRNLDRTTLLALVAAKLAIDDAKLEITDENRNDIGVVLGSTMGSVHSISEFDKEGLREGPRYVNPAHFPNTVINSPASQVAIRFGLRGLNSTIATGFCSSLDAIGYGITMLKMGRAKVLLVGGVEELCVQTFLGFYKSGLLSTSQQDGMPFFEPGHPQSSGTLIGEGASFLIIENEEEACKRNVPVYAELLSYGASFEPKSVYRYDSLAKSPTQAARSALEEAKLTQETIEFVASCANSIRAFDRTEENLLRNYLNSVRSDFIVFPKRLIGECFSAAGILSIAFLIGFKMREALFSINHAIAMGLAEESKDRVSIAFVNELGLMGNSSAILLGLGNQ